MNSSEDIFDALLDVLKNASDIAYYKLPVPAKIDLEISDVLAKVIQYGQEDLLTVLKEIDQDYGQVLGLFAERAASIAVRRSSKELIKDGILALLIYDFTADTRDTLLVLSVLHDAAIRIGADPYTLFEEIGSIFGQSEFLLQFLKRNEEDKSIEAMGYQALSTKEGIVYKRTW